MQHWFSSTTVSRDFDNLEDADHEPALEKEWILTGERGTSKMFFQNFEDRTKSKDSVSSIHFEDRIV